MEIEPLVPRFEDPFSSFSLISLLRTKVGHFRGVAVASEEQEPEFFHEFFRSTALTSNEKLSEQANMIVHGSLELPNTDSMHRALPQGIDTALAVNAMDQPQIKRRPALGRKRSQFSLRPNASQSCSNTDALSSIENLQDPEEFFAAFERLENADRLFKKLKGNDSTDPTQNPPKTRTRRQGILGKTVSYKHLYPQLPDTVEKHSSSQEENHELGGDLSSQTEIPTPANVASYTVVDDCTQKEAPDVPGVFLEMETSDSKLLNVSQGKDSVAMVENSVGRLLDHLLSDCENLDEGGMISLLHERLQLKPITVHRVTLPNPASAPVNELSNLQKVPLKQPDEFPTNGLSFLRKIRSPFNGKTPAKLQLGPGNSNSPQTSPTPKPLKSPLSSIARLQRLNAKVDMPKNPVFELLKENRLSGTHYSSVVDTGLHDISSPVNISTLDTKNLNFSHDFTATDVDGIRKHANNCSDKTPVKFPLEADNSSCLQTSLTPPRSPFCSSPTPQRHEPQFNIPLGPNRSPGKKSSSVVDLGIQAVSPPVDTDNHDARRLNFGHVPPAAHIDRQRLSFDGNLQFQEENNTLVGHHISPQVLTDDLTHRSDGSTWENPSRSVCDVYFRPDGHNESKTDEVEAIPYMTMVSQTSVLCLESPMTRTANSSGCQLPDRSSPTADTSLPVDGNSGNLDISPELDKEELQAPSRISLKKQKKRKDFQRRQSLAGAGTSWQDGVRRSTRIKIRPLEHWRGERFLFGRIHDSLATVIGLKYASPAKGRSNGSPVLKVKSYVSKEYADLLEKAALH